MSNLKMSLDAELLQQIYEEEEADTIVYSIREELMNRVMEGCYKIYIRKQSTRFIIQCAYDALVKFLCFQFYYHYEPPDIRDPMWVPDEPIEPSPKDTWAHGAVPIRPRYYKSDSSDEEETKTNHSKDSKDDAAKCFCLNHTCDCMDSYPNLIKDPNLSFEKPCPSRVKFSPKSSKVGLSEKLESKEWTVKLIDSLASSEISSANKSTVDTSRSQSEAAFTPPASVVQSVIRKKERAVPKDQRVEVPTAIQRGSEASVVGLPPIRVNTKLYSRAEEKPKRKK